MRFILYHKWDQLPESAHALFKEAEQQSLFLSRVWLENLTTHALAEQQSLVLACVVEDGKCDDRFLAILPLMKHPQGNLSSLSNSFTSLYSLLISNHNKDVVLTCLAQGLANGLAHELVHDPVHDKANNLDKNFSQTPTQSILFEPIDTNDSNIIRLRQLMESCGFQSRAYFRFYNWMHPVNGQSFAQYMAERPANLRNTIRRKRRKLERDFGYEIRLFKDTGTDLAKINSDSMNKALEDYHEVYKNSWKTNEFFSDFTPNLVKSLTRLGWSRLAILYVNEQPVAAQIWFVVHNKANIYRLVFDKNWKSYSLGSILTEYLMRYVIDTDKVTEIDFLTGNEAYKQDWMTVRRECFGIRFAKLSKQKNTFVRTIQSLKKLLSHS